MSNFGPSFRLPPPQMLKASTPAKAVFSQPVHFFRRPTPTDIRRRKLNFLLLTACKPPPTLPYFLSYLLAFPVLVASPLTSGRISTPTSVFPLVLSLTSKSIDWTYSPLTFFFFGALLFTHSCVFPPSAIRASIFRSLSPP